MGGRGASSGISVSGKPYGSEYRTVLQYRNIKFLIPTDGHVKAPLETMTKGRIYVTIGTDGEPRYISFYDEHNLKFEQIDLRGNPHVINGKNELPHTHKGYIHDENGTFSVSSGEQKLIDTVRNVWYNRHGKR